GSGRPGRGNPPPRPERSNWGGGPPPPRPEPPVEAESRPAPRPATESSVQGDFGTGGLTPIDPSEDSVPTGKSDSLFVMRQAAPPPSPAAAVPDPTPSPAPDPAPAPKAIVTVKPARASLTPAPKVEPASLVSTPEADLSSHAVTWNIQIGAFPTSSAAQERIDAAQAAAADLLQGKVPFTMAVSRGNQTIFRARFSGFDEGQAREACKRLTR